MKVLVTGVAGFIGAHTARRLVARGDQVIGIDNLNHYYDVNLKHARLDWVNEVYADHFNFYKLDLIDREALTALFAEHQIDKVIHLAAQAGVRYSLEAPHDYIDSNIAGFMNILEACRHAAVQHLVYASSSSVYGANEAMPFSVNDNVDHPLSLYAATKKANELMAHTYSHLYQLPTTGLRFFTVYGPWGRPDMSPFLFANAIVNDEPINVFNYGKHRRDFTYIDDIVEGIVLCLDHNATANAHWSGETPDPGSSRAPWKIYNIGCKQPVALMDYIQLLEQAFGKTADKNLLPLQPGDVPDTYADIQTLMDELAYQPKIQLPEGVAKFADWYKTYFRV
ncbi:MAG: NAD-dependent epimerase [Cellvibrionaceae bacterium]|nr:NAD-dependent epimerase [Cellvibrionaceae bacterium]